MSENTKAAMRSMASQSKGYHVPMSRPRALLEALSVLHRQGFGRLRIAPSRAPSGMHWRYRIRPVTGMRWDHGAQVVGSCPEMTGSLGGREAAGRGDHTHTSPAQLAAHLADRFPGIVIAGKGADPSYTDWYRQILETTDGLFIAEDDGVITPGGRRLPHPPPGEGAAPDRRPSSLSAWPLDAWSASGSTPTVLLMTGALNPIHRGHVAMMETARAHLEAQDIPVIGGLISPSNDRYLQPKYRRSGSRVFTAWQRLAMCRAVVRTCDWLDCAAWEASVPDRWPDFPEVIDTLYRQISQQYPTATVHYVCGADHFQHLQRGLGHPGQRVVVIPRSNRPVQDKPEVGIQIAPVLSETVADISATRVRAALAEGAPVDRLLHPDVVRILRVLMVQ